MCRFAAPVMRFVPPPMLLPAPIGIHVRNKQKQLSHAGVDSTITIVLMRLCCRTDFLLIKFCEIIV